MPLVCQPATSLEKMMYSEKASYKYHKHIEPNLSVDVLKIF